MIGGREVDSVGAKGGGVSERRGRRDGGALLWSVRDLFASL
jgi:hypothetical protein